jgi:hypothetical protein
MLPTYPQPEPTRLVRYWHPRLGGWHHAELIRIDDKGRKGKFAVVRDCGRSQRHSVPANDIREVAA